MINDTKKDNKKNVDEYLEQVIAKGDEGSALLTKLTAPTIKNCQYIDVIKEGMNGMAVLKNLPQDHVVVVYSIGGDPNITDLVPYTKSMVDRLHKISLINGLTPLAFMDVVYASKGDSEDVITIGNTLRSTADNYGLAIINGELAILGNRVNCTANINGTMISIAKTNSFDYAKLKNGMFLSNGLDNNSIYAAAFDHKGKAVWGNSDGQGTKAEFQERSEDYIKALLDTGAMQWDDTIKAGADAMVRSRAPIHHDPIQAAPRLREQRVGG